MHVQVFMGTSDEANRLGEVLIGPETSVGELRRVVQARYSLQPGFRLRRRNVPIHPGQDHYPADEFFSDATEDHIIVEP